MQGSCCKSSFIREALMFRHPKYYKELRKAGNELAKRNAVKEDLACSGSSPARNKSDQAISDEASTEATSVRPDPGLKRQASSTKLIKHQAASVKPQAASVKLKATSDKLQDS